MSTHEKPDVPALPFFESGNVYTGSFRQSFRFRIAKAENALAVSCWNQDVCFEKAESPETEHFPLTQDGLSACMDWIVARQPE